MGYIPKDAKWYLAEIVEEIRVEGHRRSLVHINTVLVKADSPNEAYKRALELGQQVNSTYLNSAGEKVKCRFRGLGDLNVIHDSLEHGAELIYRRKVKMTEKKIQSLVPKKQKLGVFAPIEPVKIPNFLPKNIADELKKRGCKF